MLSKKNLIEICKSFTNLIKMLFISATVKIHKTWTNVIPFL